MNKHLFRGAHLGITTAFVLAGLLQGTAFFPSSVNYVPYALMLTLTYLGYDHYKLWIRNKPLAD